MAGTLGIFGICLLFAWVHMSSATTVNIPDKVYKIARGDKAVIPCVFTPSKSITSVTWTADPDVKDDPEIYIVGYFTPTNKIKVYPKYKGRANVVVDMLKGTANLELLGTTKADTRDYECKVQDPEDEEGLLFDKASLVVLVAPSPPICNIVGKTEYFENIQLTCRSEEGTPTPSYKWESYNVNNVLRPLPLKATDQNGALSLVNISMDTSGYYICTSTNEIKSAKCNVTLRVNPRVNIPDKVYKIARGDKAVIPCVFTPSKSITSVTWTADPDVKDDPEIYIVSYFTTTNKIKVYTKYKGRANVVVDMVKGTFNLELLSTTNADTRDYECKVQDPDDEEGLLFDKASLVVLVAPSPPICNIVGKTEYSENIQLTCRSEEGTPTPSYKWESYNVNNVLRPLPLKATDQNGVLSLVNISMDTSGYYICTSTNEIKSAKCNVTLRVDPPSPVYDPNYCYILDSILLLYAVIITAFFVRERPLQKKSDDTYREIEAKPGQRRRTDQVYQGLSSATEDTYDALHMQQIHPPPR